MKGFIRQRGDAWELRVYLGADPVTGKQRYSTRTVRAGKREAQRVLNEMITEAERGLCAATQRWVNCSRRGSRWRPATSHRRR
jgi:integrase